MEKEINNDALKEDEKNELVLLQRNSFLDFNKSDY